MDKEENDEKFAILLVKDLFMDEIPITFLKVAVNWMKKSYASKVDCSV